MKKRIVNALTMKSANRYQVLNCIRSGIIFRADIARVMSLTRASITNIVDELIHNGLVIEGKYQKTNYGKRAIELKLNTNAKYALGITLNRNTISVSIVDLYGKPREYKRISVTAPYSVEIILEEINVILQTYIIKYKLDSILGIGISSPGPVDEINGTILNPPNMKMWHNFNIVAYFKDKYELPCLLEKDTSCSALLERTSGVCKNIDSFIWITIDTGIGSAIVSEGQISKGLGFAGEIGHTSIDPINGLECSCGNKGCVELYASITAISRICQEQGITADSWEEFCNLVHEGHKLADAIFKKQIEHLSYALINILNTVNIGKIVIGGRAISIGTRIIEELEPRITGKTLAPNTQKVELLLSNLSDIDISSSGNIILENYFNNML